MENKLHQWLKDELNSILPFLIQTRKHLHKHPELSFNEKLTSEFIQKIFAEHGINFQRGLVNTGLVATIVGDKPGITRALRAELDALPITEKNDVEYKSVNEGIMHACGHDVHMTCVIGAALLLNKIKSEIEGTIHFIFQPGEEKLPGGASLMIKDGLLENLNPSYIIAQHVYPNLLAGQIGICSGQYMASSDEIYITVKGKGGHGALPHLTVDPIVAASHIIIGLQNLVSRNANPLTPSVLTIGKINSDGGATNVIPEKVYLEGTFRTMNETWRKEAKEKISNMVLATAKAFGAEAEVNIISGYPMLKNDTEISKMVTSKATQYLGGENVIAIPQRMTSEDFAYFAEKVPCCFYRLGTNNKQNEYANSVHSPNFDIDLQAIETGSGLIAALVL